MGLEINSTSNANPASAALPNETGLLLESEGAVSNEELRGAHLELLRLADNTDTTQPDLFTTSIELSALHRLKINTTLRTAGLSDVIFYWSSREETASGPIIYVRGSAIVRGVAIEVKGAGSTEGGATYNAATALVKQAKNVPVRENPPTPNTTIELKTSIELPRDMRLALEQQLSATRLTGPVLVEPSSESGGIYYVEAAGVLANGTLVSIKVAGTDNQRATAAAIRRLVREYPAQ